MSSIPQESQPVNPAELAPAPPKRVMKIVLRPLREDDPHELPVEVDIEQSIPFLLRQGLELRQERDFQAARLARVKTLMARAEARVDDFEEFVAERLKSYVAKHKTAGTKHCDIVLDAVGLADVKARIGMRTLPPSVEITDEPALLAHFTAAALPTDTKLGPYELVPASWKLKKLELNELVKGGTQVPGVALVQHDDNVYLKEL